MRDRRDATAKRKLETVSIVSGICVQHDAISASVRDDALALSKDYGFRTKVFSYRNEYPEIDAVIVNNLPDVVLNRFFRESDLVIYHFGVYYELFNAIFMGNGHAPQIVRYHNITPRSVAAPRDWPTIDKSLMQMHNMSVADRIWPVSESNRLHLLETGVVPDEKIDVIPLAVGDGARKSSLLDKTSDAINLLFVGRFVQSKGLTDLIEIMGRLKDRCAWPVSLRLVGSQRFSHGDYLETVTKLIRQRDLADCVTIVGEVSDGDLEAEYARAHILVLPSYHEGFCKPVVEAMRFGCLPVTYDAGHLRHVADGYSATVPAGDIAQLGKKLEKLAAVVMARSSDGGDAVVEVDRGALRLADYEAQVDRIIDYYGFPNVSDMLRQSARAMLGIESPEEEAEAPSEVQW